LAPLAISMSRPRSSVDKFRLTHFFRVHPTSALRSPRTGYRSGERFDPLPPPRLRRLASGGGTGQTLDTDRFHPTGARGGRQALRALAKQRPPVPHSRRGARSIQLWMGLRSALQSLTSANPGSKLPRATVGRPF
jgi:hypothetical protein